MNKLIGIAIVVLMLLPGVVSAEELSIKVGGRAWDIDSINNVRSFLLEKAEVLHLKDVGATKSFLITIETQPASTGVVALEPFDSRS